jgi:predicted transcriptional regulator YheO
VASYRFRNMAEACEVMLPVMHAIATTIGVSCEVVLHDLAVKDRLGSTIIAIENGHVTGRAVGGPTTNLGLEALRSRDGSPDRFNYATRTPDGRELRSSSVYFHNDAGELIGALCINLDLATYQRAYNALGALMNGRDQAPVFETFGVDIDEVLAALIHEALVRADKPFTAMTRDERVELFRYLDSKGAFLIKRAADRIARSLRLSRVTVYSYLQEARATDAPTPSIVNGVSAGDR